MADGRVTYEIRLKDQISKQLSRISTQAAASAQNLRGRLASALKVVGGAFKKFKSIVNSQAASIVSGIVGIGAAFTALRSGFSRAIQFDRSISEIETIMDTSRISIDETRESIKRLAQELGKPAPEVAKSYYQILSSGITDAADAAQILRGSLELSTAGLSTTTEAVNLLTSAFNAYKIEVSQETVQATNDLLFKMVELGRVTIPEAAASLGRLMPSAAALKVPLEEVGAAVATLTLNGLSVAEAVTQVNAVLTAFLRKGELSREMFGQFSGVMGGSVIKAKGLRQAMIDLAAAVGGNEDKLQTVMGRVEGVRAVMSLTGNQSETFARQIDELSNSAGASSRAFEIMQDTLSTKVGILKESFVQGLGEASEAMLGFLSTMTADEVRQLGDSLAELTARTASLGARIGGTLGTGFATVSQSLDAVVRSSLDGLINFGDNAEEASQRYIKILNEMAASGMAVDRELALQRAAQETADIFGEGPTAARLKEYMALYDNISEGRTAILLLADATRLAQGQEAAYTNAIAKNSVETFKYKEATAVLSAAKEDLALQMGRLRDIDEDSIARSKEAGASQQDLAASSRIAFDKAAEAIKDYNNALRATQVPGAAEQSPFDLSVAEDELKRILALLGDMPEVALELETPDVAEVLSALTESLMRSSATTGAGLGAIIGDALKAIPEDAFLLVSEDDVKLAKQRVADFESAIETAHYARMEGLTKENEKVKENAEVEKARFLAEQLAAYQSRQAILEEQAVSEEVMTSDLRAFAAAMQERISLFNDARDSQTRKELNAIKRENAVRRAELRQSVRAVQQFFTEVRETLATQSEKTAASLFDDFGGAFKDLSALAVVSPELKFDEVLAQIDRARTQLEQAYYEVDGVRVKISDSQKQAILEVLRMIEVTTEASKAAGQEVSALMESAGGAIAMLSGDAQLTPLEKLQNKLELIAIARRQLNEQPLISDEDRSAISAAIDDLERMALVEERTASRGTALMRSLGGAIASLAEKVKSVPELELADTMEKIARAREQLNSVQGLSPEQRADIEFLLRSIENVEASAAAAAATGTAALQNAGGALASLQGDVTITPEMRVADLQAKIAAARQQLQTMDSVSPEQQAQLEAMIANVEKFELAAAKAAVASSTFDKEISGWADTFGLIKDGIEELTEPFDNMKERIKDIGAAGTEAFVNGLTDALMDVIVQGASAEEAFKKFAAAFLADIGRMILQLLIYKAIRTMVLGFEDGGQIEGGTGEMQAVGLANGGVVSGGLGRALPIKGYANGGPIVRSPHIALIGEGKMNEAVVPLPDGRSIPVEMRGAAETTNVNINIEAVDAASVDRLFFQRRDTLSAIIQRALREDRTFRNAIGGV